MVALENKIAITSESSCIRVWDLTAEKCKFTISDFDDYSKIAVSQDSKTLVCYMAGVNTLRYDSISL